jgi:hypothetical protein
MSRPEAPSLDRPPVLVKKFQGDLKAVTRQRGAVYGHPLVNFERIAHLKEGVSDCKDPAIRHALEMMCVNMARLVETPDHYDSVLDVAGYAKTILMILDEREKRSGSA